MERDLEQELLADSVIAGHCKNAFYAQNLYAALCNMQWQPLDVFPVLRDERWSCSWRHAGSIVANIRNGIADAGADKEDYLDWYCSGIRGDSDRDFETEPRPYVAEGTVTEEIRQDLARVGWHPIPILWEIK